MRHAHVLIVLATVLLTAGAGFPEEAVEGRLKDLLAKRKAGQELTPEEREFLTQNARFMKKPLKGEEVLGARLKGDRPEWPGAAGLAAQPMDPRQDTLRELIIRLNVIDRAMLSAAQQLWEAGQKDDAIALAEKSATKTPDVESAGVAVLVVGRFLTELGKTEEARKKLRTVTGRAAALAMTELAEPLMKAKDSPGLLAAFKDLLAAQKNSLDRCRVAKALIDMLDRSTPDGLAAEQRAELMQAIAASVPYEDALAAKEELAKEQPPPPPPGQGRFGPGQPGGMMVGPGGPGNMPPELQERMRALRDVPPDQRPQAIGAIMKDIAKQAKQLEAEGRMDEARRLREILERHEQMEARMKDMNMKKPNGRGMEPPRRDPAEVREEIKRLEDQGFMEEAKKLRRELEQTNGRQVTDEKF